MPETLGICVATLNAFEHLMGITLAANRADKKVKIFLTGEAVHITQNERFPDLVQLAKVGVCEVSYLANGFKDKEIAGLTDKDFVTQAANAEMVEECDRYLIL
jgi:hypothetical protein